MTPNNPSFVFNPFSRVHAKTKYLSLAAMATILFVSLFSGRIASADEQSVREYLAQKSNTAYLQQGEFRIERVEFESRTFQNAVVFQKYIQDIPLHGGRVIVLESSDGQVTHVFDDSSQALKLNLSKPAVKASTAERSIRAVGKTGSVSKLVWFRSGNEAIPAWEVTTSLADSGKVAAPTGLETVVDAMTGRVLSQRQLDSKSYAPGSPEAADGVFPRIVINDTIGPAGSQAYAAPFDAVVASSVGCTGTLIAPNVVLSARHCSISAGDTFIFGDDSSGGGIFSATVQSSTLPDGGGTLLDGGDVSIHTLTSSVPANIATPTRLIDETNSLVGMVAATLGYGFNGVGSQGHQFSSDGLRWGGENIIDVYGTPASQAGSNIISTDFDDGTAAANQIPSGSATPLPIEATTAPGDSGGPVMVQLDGEWLIAGVLSGGTTNTSVYGDVSWWTGTALFRAQIEALGGEFLGGAEIVCGNGLLQGGEQCDDGNLIDGDGCSASCSVESGFSCDTPPGQPSVCELIPEGCSAPALFIPDTDTTGASDSLTLTGGQLTDLNVTLDIDHTWVGDLVITLTNESTGTTVTLLDRPGLPEVDAQFGCGNENINVTLDDDAIAAADDECSATPPAIGGTLAPTEALAAFNGESAEGIWTLSLSDFFDEDAGTLQEWCLEATAPTSDTDGDGVPDDEDNCTLVPNADQRDTNGDGFGNICDPDFDNNGVVNFLDVNAWRPLFGTACGDVDEDINGDGLCNFADYAIVTSFFLQPPGPAAEVPPTN
ncbi:MAG: proprotein convertase P-domain-containing protein [Gammaproteobacteria bacterium]